MRRLILASAILLACAACNEALPDPSLVTSLRVLGVRAEPPELAPGGTVHLDALYADPEGNGRPLKKAWAICDPGDGGVGTCGDPTRVTVLGSNETADWTVPPTMLDGLSDAEKEIGRDVYVVFGVEYDDGSGQVDTSRADHDIAFKRVRVSTNTAPNANPHIASMTVDGKASALPIDVTRGVAIPLQVQATADSQQAWSSPDGASGTEESRYTWLVTAGSLRADVTYADKAGEALTNGWSIPSTTRAAAPGTLWVVLRDGRGGIDWRTQPVTIH